MLRDLVSVSVSLVVLCLFAGCGGGGGEPDPTEYEADGFEVDDTRDLAKEQPVNGPPQYRTLWPAGDEDFIRFRVNEVDPDGADEDGPHYLVTYPSYTAAVRSEWWNDLGRIELGVDPCYRQSDDGFTEPGIYYVKLFDDDATGGVCRTWITLRRDGDPKPDLVATAMSAPAEVTSGEETAFGVWVVNQGGMAALAGFDVALYLSADGVTPVGGAIAEEEVTYDLPSGYSYDLPITVASFPATLVGPVYLIAEVDTNSEVNEGSYEGGNIFVGSTLVDPAAYSAALPAPAPIVPTAGAPTATLAGRILYPADDPDTTALDESDMDEFELQLDVGLSYYEIWTEKLVGWADTKIEIVDGVGDPLDPPVEAEDGGLGNGASYLCYDSGGASGSVWIRVTDEQGNSGGYDLVVRASAAPPNGPDRFEPDGGTGTWRVLREGDPGMFDGRSFSTADDEDWVAYPVSVANAPRKHTIMTYDLSSSPACQTKLEICRSGATTALHTDETAGGAVLTDLVLAAGLYYVCVTNTDTEAGGTYLLRADITD